MAEIDFRITELEKEVKRLNRLLEGCIFLASVAQGQTLVLAHNLDKPMEECQEIALKAVDVVVKHHGLDFESMVGPYVDTIAGMRKKMQVNLRA